MRRNDAVGGVVQLEGVARRGDLRSQRALLEVADVQSQVYGGGAGHLQPALEAKPGGADHFQRDELFDRSRVGDLQEGAVAGWIGRHRARSERGDADVVSGLEDGAHDDPTRHCAHANTVREQVSAHDLGAGGQGWHSGAGLRRERNAVYPVDCLARRKETGEPCPPRGVQHQNFSACAAFLYQVARAIERVLPTRAAVAGARCHRRGVVQDHDDALRCGVQRAELRAGQRKGQAQADCKRKQQGQQPAPARIARVRCFHHAPPQQGRGGCNALLARLDQVEEPDRTCDGEDQAEGGCWRERGEAQCRPSFIEALSTRIVCIEASIAIVEDNSLTATADGPSAGPDC